MTWQRLHALGCDSAQGCFISRPVPAGQLAALLGPARRPPVEAPGHRSLSA